MSSVTHMKGAALNNQAAEIGRITETLGPVVLAVKNDGEVAVVISVEKLSDSAALALSEDTAVTDEDTGYDGDTTDLVFTGEDLANTPIIPGSVTIAPTAGVDSVDATDRDGDGKLYTSDVDEDFCGTIDYFTGALELSYPAGKAPNTTNILADYSYQDEACVPGGFHSVNIPTNLPDETYIIKAAAAGQESYVAIDAFIGADQ